MAELQNSFIAGRMNKDLDERLVRENEYRDALNITVSSSEGSNIGSVQNSLGNLKIADLATLSKKPITGATCIGAVKQEALNLIYWFVSANEFDGIYEYNQLSGVSSKILQSNKATESTPSKLNFSKEFLITGVNYINGFLYWTDNYNPPRKINISRARSYTTDDARIDDDINVILAPPLNSPKVILSKDTVDESNNMEDKFIYFAYRYKYIDGQYSSISPFSAVAFGPGGLGFDYEKGSNVAMTNVYNTAEIFFETGGANVTDIQLLFRDTRSLNVSIIENFNKDKYSYTDYTVKSFRFKNNKNYSAITSDQVTRLFDNVPLLAKAQDFVGNRLMYGNYTQFFNIKGVDGNDIKVDLTLELGSTQTTPADTPIQTFRSDRDYEIGIEYLDQYGRVSTVLTSPNNTAYIPPANSSTGNSLLVKVKNEPPSWATNFRFLIKQSKGEYYNIFPIVFYSDGLYRYFKINDSDLDKFKVGEYLILKSDASNPTYTNKKYKTLELEKKVANFLGGNELEGLYFKIKVDSPNEIGSKGVFNYNSTGYGYGDVDKTLNKKFHYDIFSNNVKSVAEDAVHYGNGNPSTLVTSGNRIYTYNRDWRVTILITSPTTYSVYGQGVGYTWNGLGILISSNNTITHNVDLPIVIASSPRAFFRFTSPNGFIKGDRWVINLRGTQYPKNAAIIPGKNWSATSPETEVKIQRGAIITLKLTEDKFNNYAYLQTQSFPPSPSSYVNIEEWWYESGACNSFIFKDETGVDIKNANVSFRRGKSWGLAFGNNSDFAGNYISPSGTTPPTINPEMLKYPIRMIIKSTTDVNFGQFGAAQNQQPRITLDFSITQQDNSTVFETEGKSIDNDIFHELSTTYRIEGGYHKVLWSYQDFTTAAGGFTNLGQAIPGTATTATDVPHKFSIGDSVYVNSDNISYVPSGQYTIVSIPDAYNIVIDLPFPGSGPIIGGGISYSQIDTNQTNYSTSPLVVKLNNPGTNNTDFNGWAFGTGLESYRIFDDWNKATLEYSVRVNSFVDDYKERHSYNAICYSGIYGENTGVNRLNEFNLSLANFKYLDMDFGSIQRIHARDNDMLIFQQDKISKLLYGKNLLFDAVGGGQVASIPEVLGNQISFPYEYGISNNPESFAEWGNELFFTDSRRGAVINISGDQIDIISKYGMNDHFRDMMRDNSNTQKVGGFDPYLGMYTLSNNEISVVPCKLSLSTNKRSVVKLGKKYVFFEIMTELDWDISIEDDGFGTDWVSNGSALSGSGNKVIYSYVATNNTGAVRTLRYVVNYCIDKTATFTLTQGTSNTTQLVNIVFTNNSYISGPTKSLYE